MSSKSNDTAPSSATGLPTAASRNRDRHARAALTQDRIKGLARRTFSKAVLSEIGTPAGLVALDAERFPDPVLVSTAGSLGAKLQLAAQLGLHATIGADLVNHCVNDVAIQGATPLYFLDYLAAGHLDPDVVQQVIGGLVDACKANGCALIGGETAETPSLYTASGYELAGFLTGVVSRPRLLTGELIAEGDCLLALPSNGLGTSGFSLAQDLLFHTAGYRPDQYVNELADKVGATLMRPHRSFLHIIRKLIQAEVVTGFAHIAGGGLTANLPRALPRGLAVNVDLTTWEPPALFAHLQRLADSAAEPFDTEHLMASFNMGIGLVAFVPADLLKKARTTLTRMNERSFAIGRVVRRATPRISYS